MTTEAEFKKRRAEAWLCPKCKAKLLIKECWVECPKCDYFDHSK